MLFVTAVASALLGFAWRSRAPSEASARFSRTGAVTCGTAPCAICLISGIAHTPPIGTTPALYVLRGTPGLPLAGHPAIGPPLVVALVFLIAGFGFKVGV